MTNFKLSNVNVSIMPSKGINGEPKRRLFVPIKNIAELPAELFAVKISQSKNAEFGGKVAFKYLMHRVNAQAKNTSLAPQSVMLHTPLEEIKNVVVAGGSSFEWTLAINIPGPFANITTPVGTYAIYDMVRLAAENGNPGYYIKNDALVTVEFEPAIHKETNKEYYRLKFSTDLTPDQLFQRSGKSQIWGAEDSDSSASAPAPIADVTGW